MYYSECKWLKMICYLKNKSKKQKIRTHNYTMNKNPEINPKILIMPLTLECIHGPNLDYASFVRIFHGYV